MSTKQPEQIVTNIYPPATGPFLNLTYYLVGIVALIANISVQYRYHNNREDYVRYSQQTHWLPTVDFRFHRCTSLLLRKACYRYHLVSDSGLTGNRLVNRSVPDTVHGS